MLVNQLEANLYARKGKAVTNFATTLPKAQSDLAKEIFKDPYKFDFLNLSETHFEKELEDGLVSHMTKFLLELGHGFSYVGRQYMLNVAGEEFFIDLLFYHLKLRSFVVIELKTGKFIPEYAGKLNFYLNAAPIFCKISNRDGGIKHIFKRHTPSRFRISGRILNCHSRITSHKHRQMCRRRDKCNK